MDTQNATLRSVLNAEFGLSPKSRLLMSINFNASIAMRRALQKMEANEEFDYAEIDAMDSVAKELGFSNENPTLQLDRALEFMLAAYTAAKELSMVTDLNESGQKTRPFAWLIENDMVRTPIGWLKSDMKFRVDRSLMQQRTNVLLAYPEIPASDNVEAYTAAVNERDAAVNNIMEATRKRASELAADNVMKRATILQGHLNLDVMKLSSDELTDLLEEAVDELQINWHDVLTSAAERHQANFLKGLNEGKLMTLDADLMVWLGPKSKQSAIREAKDKLMADTVA